MSLCLPGARAGTRTSRARPVSRPTFQDADVDVDKAIRRPSAEPVGSRFRLKPFDLRREIRSALLWSSTSYQNAGALDPCGRRPLAPECGPSTRPLAAGAVRIGPIVVAEPAQGSKPDTMPVIAVKRASPARGRLFLGIRDRVARAWGPASLAGKARCARRACRRYLVAGIARCVGRLFQIAAIGADGKS